MLNLTPLKAFNDNYIWLIQNPQKFHCAVVDPGDAEPVLKWLAENPQWRLTDIVITHHHRDHTGGISALKQHSQPRVIGPALENIPSLDLPVHDNQTLELLGSEFNTLLVPGHTKGHIAYYCAAEQPFVLSGDTLFAAGCGRIFEGTAAQMYDSLQRLAQLPDATLVYCAHEYTLSNLKFAATVEPTNVLIQQRLQKVISLREQDMITLPSTIALEKQTNPFLRCTSTELIQQVSQHQQPLPQGDPVSIFAALRAWKDTF
ncbi:MAG: hydroxyacylglutathione hydrolase [Gammaproteobacteria bacterium]|nr:hydroxyacylglutathione hydrolase [Gammaproteobacteria bacterium]